MQNIVELATRRLFGICWLSGQNYTISAEGSELRCGKFRPVLENEGDGSAKLKIN